MEKKIIDLTIKELIEICKKSNCKDCLLQHDRGCFKHDMQKYDLNKTIKMKGENNK